ncbi:MAG: bifunctional methylenetetrahydrofolate dehydrogenase/methenyltetrahydrofolate cyclohydrolase FolD [Candidatus Eremiobacteraeota bacterium]|nr:bifunctional methylenetetrahydrofolate dehydrogenase/methenyltetrahydrofolate cyclohydrolase FolD [Candidatus Eremiobacteraeota bacterium]
MSAEIISGKEVSREIKENLAKEVEDLKARGIIPGLAVVLVGDDPASQVYVRNKVRACEKVGIKSVVQRLPSDIPEEDLLRIVRDLNENDEIHGILVQLPLPDHIDEQKVVNIISPEKDADGFHPYNMGRLLTGEECPVPCTPAGIMELIHRTGIELKGKEAVVIGRSNIVGKPVAILLLREHATVTICHSRTRNLSEVCKRADVVIAAVGRAKMVKKDFIKPGAVVIDVGINRDENGKLVGDVDFEDVKEVAGYITPVPGGVGPMTIAMLLVNTVSSAKKKMAHAAF